MKPALLLFAAATVGAAGCANNDVSLSIVQMEAVTDGHQLRGHGHAGAGTVGRDRGVLDVSPRDDVRLYRRARRSATT